MAIEGDRLSVGDRGYAKFALFNKIVLANSSYVCRLRNNSVRETVEEKYRNDDACHDAAMILGSAAMSEPSTRVMVC